MIDEAREALYCLKRVAGSHAITLDQVAKAAFRLEQALLSLTPPAPEAQQAAGAGPGAVMQARLAELYLNRCNEPLAPQPVAGGVPVPHGLARSDAEFWMRNRTAILQAIAAQGFTLVSTAHGCWLMKFRNAVAQASQEPKP